MALTLATDGRRVEEFGDADSALSRAIDDREITLRQQSRVFFQISGAGHEALLLGLARSLRPAYDWFFPYYRDRALALALVGGGTGVAIATGAGDTDRPLTGSTLDRARAAALEFTGGGTVTETEAGDVHPVCRSGETSGQLEAGRPENRPRVRREDVDACADVAPVHVEHGVRRVIEARRSPEPRVGRVPQVAGSVCSLELGRVAAVEEHDLVRGDQPGDPRVRV